MSRTLGAAASPRQPTPTSSATTRNRILTATNELFRRQGYNGTSLSQIVEAAQATTGSVYHFFPGGKDELTAEVLRTAGQAYGDFVELILRGAADPATGMADAFAGAATELEGGDYTDLCPIGTVAREVANTHPELRQVAETVMTAWTERLAAVFVDAGVDTERAEQLALISIATIEGGFVVARTQRSSDAWLAIGTILCETIRGSLPDADRHPAS